MCKGVVLRFAGGEMGERGAGFEEGRMGMCERCERGEVIYSSAVLWGLLGKGNYNLIYIIKASITKFKDYCGKLNLLAPW
jgi:hypothetical protein